MSYRLSILEGKMLDHGINLYSREPSAEDIVAAVLLAHHIDDYEEYSEEGLEQSAETSIRDIDEILFDMEFNVKPLKSVFTTTRDYKRFVSKLLTITGSTLTA